MNNEVLALAKSRVNKSPGNREQACDTRASQAGSQLRCVPGVVISELWVQGDKWVGSTSASDQTNQPSTAQPTSQGVDGEDMMQPSREWSISIKTNEPNSHRPASQQVVCLPVSISLLFKQNKYTKGEGSNESIVWKSLGFTAFSAKK